MDSLEYSIFDFLKLLGGLGVFIYGMKVMSEGIQKVAGKELRRLLALFTNNRFAGVFSGMAITSLIQSSSATTVMVVSFVNAGLLTVMQAVGVIMGANVGTTLTGWLVSTFGFKFHITDFALPVIALSVPLVFSGVKRWKFMGEFLLGFGFLFMGLEIMKDSVPDLKNNPEVLQFLADFSQYGIWSVLLFVFVGTMLTIIVQSSSAAMGITLVMVAQGWVPFEVGTAIILGENIGTTVTAYLASLVGNVNAKRAARAHFIFNIFGVIWVLSIFPIFLEFTDYVNMTIIGADYSVYTDNPAHRGQVMPHALATFHTTFNIINTTTLIWFTPFIVKIVERMVKDNKTGLRQELIISKNVINTPEIAIVEAKNEISKMGEITESMFSDFQRIYFQESKNEEKLFSKIKEKEDETDSLEVEITNFLVDVSQNNPSDETSGQVVNMLGITNDLERIADLVFELSLAVERKEDFHIKFKGNLEKGLGQMIELVNRAFVLMNKNLASEYDNIDIEEARSLEKQVNSLRDELRLEHLKRLGNKQERLKTGNIFRDMYSLLEKTADHIYDVNQAITGRKYL